MKEILLSACMAFVFVNVLQLHMKLKLTWKLFNCDVCLAGWFCLVISIPTVEWYLIPGYMAAAMVAIIFLKGIFNQLQK